MNQDFIARHGLWTDAQNACADELRRRVETDELRLVRLVWADTHGSARAKALSVPAFLAALGEGYNINVATFTLDASGGRVFHSFTRGGGMGLGRAGVSRRGVARRLCMCAREARQPLEGSSGSPRFERCQCAVR